MKTSHELLIVLVVVAVVAAIASTNAWITAEAPEIGVAIGVVGIVSGLAFLAFMFVRSRLMRRFEDGGESWLDLSIAKGLILLAIPIACLAAFLAVGLNQKDLAVALLVISAILILVGGVYILYRLSTAWLRQRTTHRLVIGTLAMVVRQNLPLATGLRLAADSEKGAVRIHLYRIAALLAQGACLSEAVRRGFPDCPSLPLSLIMAGERSGQLSAALDQAEALLVERARRQERIDVSVWPYVLCVLLFTFLIVSGILVAIIPKFKEIFKDFGTELPPVTMALIGAAETITRNGALAALATLLGFLVFLALPVGVYLSLRPRRVPDLAVSSQIADWIRWNTPGWHRAQFGAGMAAVLRTVRLGVRAGMNLEAAVRLATGIDVNDQLRPRIRRFADLLASGVPVRSAAQQADLDEVTAVALGGEQRGGDVEAGLRYAADYHDALVNRLWIVLRSLAWPLATLMLGAIVGTVVVALFEPLVFLINAVASGN